jgi:hypothetical protein
MTWILAALLTPKPRTGFAARMSGTSAYRGVSWHTQTSRWKAQIKVAGKDVNLGRHRDEVEAARAYDRAAICARGEKDAKLNFGIEDYAHEIQTLISMPLGDLAASLRGVEQRLQAQTSRCAGPSHFTRVPRVATGFTPRKPRVTAGFTPRKPANYTNQVVYARGSEYPRCAHGRGWRSIV